MMFAGPSMRSMMKLEFILPKKQISASKEHRDCSKERKVILFCVLLSNPCVLLRQKTTDLRFFYGKCFCPAVFPILLDIVPERVV